MRVEVGTAGNRSGRTVRYPFKKTVRSVRRKSRHSDGFSTSNTKICGVICRVTSRLDPVGSLLTRGTMTVTRALAAFYQNRSFILMYEQDIALPMIPTFFTAIASCVGAIKNILYCTMTIYFNDNKFNCSVDLQISHHPRLWRADSAEPRVTVLGIAYRSRLHSGRTVRTVQSAQVRHSVSNLPSIHHISLSDATQLSPRSISDLGP